VDTREQADVFILHPAVAVTGRVMFTLIFFLSGITHFTRMDDYVALMPAAIPLRAFWVIVSGVVELIGATLIVANRYPRLGGWLIAIFLVPVTIAVHARHSDVLLPEGRDDDGRRAPDHATRGAATGAAGPHPLATDLSGASDRARAAVTDARAAAAGARNRPPGRGACRFAP